MAALEAEFFAAYPENASEFRADALGRLGRSCSSSVFRRGHRFEMTWAHTVADTAEVVDLPMAREWYPPIGGTEREPLRRLMSTSVRVDGIGTPEHSIAVGERSRPQPAPVREAAITDPRPKGCQGICRVVDLAPPKEMIHSAPKPRASTVTPRRLASLAAMRGRGVSPGSLSQRRMVFSLTPRRKASWACVNPASSRNSLTRVLMSTSPVYHRTFDLTRTGRCVMLQGVTPRAVNSGVVANPVSEDRRD